MPLKYIQDNVLEIINPEEINFIKVCVTENAEHFLHAQKTNGKEFDITVPKKFISKHNLFGELAKLLGKEYMSYFSPPFCDVCMFNVQNFSDWEFVLPEKKGRMQVIAVFKSGQKLEVLNLNQGSFNSLKPKLVKFSEHIKKCQEPINCEQ